MLRATCQSMSSCLLSSGSHHSKDSKFGGQVWIAKLYHTLLAVVRSPYLPLCAFPRPRWCIVLQRKATC